MAFTVVFAGSIRDVPGNPMTLETAFGEVKATGIGSAFEREDVYEEALQEIAEAGGRLADIAQAALDAAQHVYRRETRPAPEDQ